MVAGVKMASDEEKIAALKAIRDKARASRLETGEDGTFAVYDEEEDENLRRAYPEYAAGGSIRTEEEEPAEDDNDVSSREEALPRMNICRKTMTNMMSGSVMKTPPVMTTKKITTGRRMTKAAAVRQMMTKRTMRRGIAAPMMKRIMPLPETIMTTGIMTVRRKMSGILTIMMKMKKAAERLKTKNCRCRRTTMTTAAAPIPGMPFPVRQRMTCRY